MIEGTTVGGYPSIGMFFESMKWEPKNAPGAGPLLPSPNDVLMFPQK